MDSTRRSEDSRPGPRSGTGTDVRPVTLRPHPPSHVPAAARPDRGSMSQSLLSDRRSLRTPADATAAELVDAQLGAAQRQLALARERLIAARRRVVALEEAVANWAEFARDARSQRV